MKFSNINSIKDDTGLVRIVDLEAAKFSVGRVQNRNIKYRLPLNLLSYYRSCEGNQKDLMEGRTPINFGNGKGGFVSTVNDALISCWSIYEEDKSPWEVLSDSIFARASNAQYAIVTTVRKIKEQLEQVIEILNNFSGGAQLIMNAVYGIIDYYNLAVDRQDWLTKTNKNKGGDIDTIQNIFHKPKMFQGEKECRFSLILNFQRFLSNNKKFGVDAIDITKYMIYHPIISFDGQHYIEKIFSLEKIHPEIMSTCHFSKIPSEEIKVYEKYLV